MRVPTQSKDRHYVYFYLSPWTEDRQILVSLGMKLHKDVGDLLYHWSSLHSLPKTPNSYSADRVKTVIKGSSNLEILLF